MRRCLTAIEHPAFGKESNSAADAGDVGAFFMVLLQPWQQGSALRNKLNDVPAGRRDDDDVSAFDIADLAIRREAQRVSGLDLASTDGRGLHPEMRLYGLAMEPVPDDAGRMEDFDRRNGGRRVAALEKHHRDVQQSAGFF